MEPQKPVDCLFYRRDLIPNVGDIQTITITLKTTAISVGSTFTQPKLFIQQGPFGDKAKLVVIPSEDLPKLKAVAELFLQAIGQGHRVGMEQLATIPAPMGRMRVLAKRCDEKLRLELGAPEFQLPLKHLIFDIRMVEELHKELDVIIKAITNYFNNISATDDGNLENPTATALSQHPSTSGVPLGTDYMQDQFSYV